MGSFEKLGILVIVVIIVMILTVAIYQWGGAGIETTAAAGALDGGTPPVTIDVGGPLPDAEDRGTDSPPPPADSGFWMPGIPKEHVIARGDSISKLLSRWGIRESFTEEIRKANPRLNLKVIQIGERIRIPDPANFVLNRKKQDVRASGFRIYVVQQGDTPESIAKNQLGSGARAGEIQALNPGMNPKRLQIGQEIKVPVK